MSEINKDADPVEVELIQTPGVALSIGPKSVQSLRNRRKGDT